MSYNTKKKNNQSLPDNSGSSSVTISAQRARQEEREIVKQIAKLKTYEPDVYKKSLEEAKKLNISLVEYLFDSPVLKAYKEQTKAKKVSQSNKVVSTADTSQPQAENQIEDNLITEKSDTDANTKNKIDQDSANNFVEEITNENISDVSEIKSDNNISNDEPEIAEENDDSVETISDEDKIDEMSQQSELVQENVQVSDEIAEENIRIEENSSTAENEIVNDQNDSLYSDSHSVSDNENNKLSEGVADEITENNLPVETVSEGEMLQPENEVEQDDSAIMQPAYTTISENEIVDNSFKEKAYDTQANSNQNKVAAVSAEEIARARAEIEKMQEVAANSDPVKMKVNTEFMTAPEQALSETDDDDFDDEVTDDDEYIDDEFDEEEDDESAYDGMTPEEIAEIKERKKVLKELKNKYNPKKATVEKSELGQYKKGLDFSNDTGIKKFKMKAGKKPFIISAIVAVVVIIAVITSVFVVLKPKTEVAALKSIALTQETTSQYVGETLDLRGVNLLLTYSNNKNKKISATNAMITSCSDNILPDTNYTITSQNSNTFVNFSYGGFTVKLKINLSEIVYEGDEFAKISVPELKQNTTISYSDILILANVKIDSNETQKRIDAGDESVTFTIKASESSDEPIELVKTATGLAVPSTVSAGNYTLTITYTVSSTKTISKTIENVQVFAE